MMPGIIVVFEGLPGCGKSSIAQEVAQRMKNVVVMPEIAELAAVRGFEVADRASIGTETWFLTQYYTRGVEAKKLKEEGKAVIMDRNYASSLAFSFANYASEKNPTLAFFVHFPSYIVNKAVGTLVKPDAYLFFEITVEESVARQSAREREELRTGDIEVLRNLPRFYSAFFTMLEPEVPLYEIDASKPKEDVLEQVINVMSNNLKMASHFAQ